VAGGLEIVVDALQAERVGRHIAHLAALEQRAGLAVAQRRGFSLVPLGFGALDAAHRDMADGVHLAQMIK
jgi:hypothetical protein